LGAQYSQGPVRPGIFATSSSSRERAGAGYYGVMDLTGNLHEMVVTIGNTWGTVFYAIHGDGSINNDTDGAGFARQLGWPGTAAEAIQGVRGADGVGLRDGAWNSAAQRLRVSDRTWAAYGTKGQAGPIRRQFDRGGRGARSAASTLLDYSNCGNGEFPDPPEQCDYGIHRSCTTGCECQDCSCSGRC